MLQIDSKESHRFLWLIGLSCLIAISCSFYFFYYKKDYDFVVEVFCDPYQEMCFQRDCSNPDDCPLNGLSDFKRYTLNAADFVKCENEDCEKACETNLINCKQLECEVDEEFGESCSSMLLESEE